MESRKHDGDESAEQWDLRVEVERLKESGFDRAAIYLEDPELVDEFRLNDILALNGLMLKNRIGDKFLFKGQEIDPYTIPSLTVQAVNKLSEILPNSEKHLTLEDAFLMVEIHRQRQAPNERIKLSNHSMAFAKKQYLYPSMACGFFHAAYFFTPFPEHRNPGDIYVPPVAFIKKVSSAEKETPENFEFAKRILERLIQYYNTELRRTHYYYNVLSPKEDDTVESMDEDDKVKIAESIKIDLKGYNGQLRKKNGGEPSGFSLQEFKFDFEQASDKFIRPLCGTHIEMSEEIIGLSKMRGKPFAKKLAEKFREIARRNPLQYFPPYTKDWLTEQLD